MDFLGRDQKIAGKAVLEDVEKLKRNSTTIPKNQLRSAVSKDSQMQALYKLLYKIDSPITFRFAVNDVVRISKARKVFREGYLPGWTEEAFIIYKRYPTNPPTYVLQDLSGKEIAGRFYTEELQKIDKSDNDLWAIEKNYSHKRSRNNPKIICKVGWFRRLLELLDKSRMAKNMTDFHIILPSNSSMQYFPVNSPNHFRTKLSRPITLNGEWECCLSEVTLPGKYFTIQPRYNDFYTVTREIEVPDETLLSTFDISLYNEDFVAGFNANMKNIFTDPPLVFTLTNNKRQLKMELKRGFDWIITP
ncbi:uncharacterized protein TNCV_875581 [Trichonephila clavipes]|nr:uncharacterized protein TNCV_875581 [Trichonephila clavipes]